MTNLSEQVYFITAEQLQQGILDGSWRNCRKEFYIRQEIDQQSVEEKIRALVTITDSKNSEGVIEVKESLAINQYTDADGNQINEIISGNTRSHAIMYQLGVHPCVVSFGIGRDSHDIEIKEFRPIPYRIFESPIDIDEAVDFQISTNDNTSQHNPYDIALKVCEMKPLLEEKYKAEGVKPKFASGMATDHLAKLFGKSNKTLTQYTLVINNVTDKLKQYIRTKKLSFDTAYTIIQRLGDKNRSQQNIDGVITDLTLLVKQQLAANTGVSIEKVNEDEIVIFKKFVTNYFDDLDAAKKAGKFETSSESSEKPIDRSSSSGSSEPVSKKQLVEDYQIVSNRVRNIKHDDLSPTVAREVNDLNVSMLELIAATNEYYPVSQETIYINKLISEIYNRRSSDLDVLADAIGDNSNELLKIRKVLGKVSKYSEVLKHLLYEKPQEQATSEIVQQDSEELEQTEQQEIQMELLNSDEVEVIQMETPDNLATIS